MLIYLAFWVSRDYNTITRQAKAGRGEFAPPHAPMRERIPPTQQYITVPSLIIRLFPAIIKGKAFGVCVCICGVGFLHPAPLLFVSAVPAKPTGDGCSPTPEGEPLSNSRHYI